MFEIWHDNDFDLAHWFYLNTNLANHEVRLRQIPKTNSASEIYRHLKTKKDLVILPAIKYETPDLILVDVSNELKPEVKLVIEFMTHTPQHDHPLQRFSRLYCAAWLGIPSILIIPEKKEKLEKGKNKKYTPVIYRANPLIYHLFIKTSQVTNTPTLLLFWSESKGYLKYDKNHPTAPYLDGDVLKLLDFTNNLVENRNSKKLVDDHLNNLKLLSDYSEDIKYNLTSGEFVETSNILQKLELKLNAIEKRNLFHHDRSFMYSPNGLVSSSSNFRTDPYAGKLCAWDILFCRDSKGKKNANLILKANKVNSTSNGKDTLSKKLHRRQECPFIFPLINTNFENHFQEFCPYTMRKQQRIYGEIPDIVIYEDLEYYVPNDH